MRKIRTLQFFIWHNGIRHPEYRAAIEKHTSLSTPEQIDKKVNAELQKLVDKEGAIISNVIINDVATSRHNNGGDDTIMRTYTIFYQV